MERYKPPATLGFQKEKQTVIDPFRVIQANHAMHPLFSTTDVDVRHSRR